MFKVPHHTFIQAAGADIDDVHTLIQCSLCCIRPNCIHRDYYYVSNVHQICQNWLQYLLFHPSVQKLAPGLMTWVIHQKVAFCSNIFRFIVGKFSVLQFLLPLQTRIIVYVENAHHLWKA